MYAVCLFIFLHFTIINVNSIVGTRSILKSVIEHNDIYNGGILYQFWIDFQGRIHGRSYGVNNHTSIEPLLSDTIIIDLTADGEECVSVDVDYVYNSELAPFSPINLILAASCKDCSDPNCIEPRWTVMAYNIKLSIKNYHH